MPLKKIEKSEERKISENNMPQFRRKPRGDMEQRMRKKRDRFKPAGFLTGGQTKLDKNKNGRIDGEDFKILRAEKPMKAAMGKSVRGYGAARTSGSGLLDEQMAPGKVIKAKMGEATDYKKYLKGLKKASDSVKMEKLNKKFKKTLGVFPTIKKKMGGGIMNKPMGYSKGSDLYSSVTGKKFKSKKEIEDMGKKAVASIKAAGESVTDKNTPMKRERLTSKFASKKMGGGMMNKPMGYKRGVMAKTQSTPTPQQKPKKPDMLDMYIIIDGKRQKLPKFKTGGDGRLRSAYVYKQAVENTKAEGRKSTNMSDIKKTRREEYGAAKDRYPNNMDKKKKMLSNVSKVLAPHMSRIKKTYDFITKPTSAKYSKGTMVMARGCKLGRKKATKIT